MGTKLCKQARIVWCDTEGGTRGVPLWDVTFVIEDEQKRSAITFCSPSSAHKNGRAKLRKSLPQAVFQDGCTKETTCVTYHDWDNKWTVNKYVVVNRSISDMTKQYLQKLHKEDILVAWNMNGHDKHVLKRTVGSDIMNSVTLWDALPWFRSCYGIPKYTLSSCRKGTPRALFQVDNHGQVHTSFADTAHLRDVVVRAAYCCIHGSKDIDAWKGVSQNVLAAAALQEIQRYLDDKSSSSST